MSRPLVSVVIPTLLRTKYAVITVQDLLAQDYPNIEVILVEQESQSPELKELAAQNPDRVRYYYAGEVSSVTRNENIGISHAKGEFILCMDDDCRLPHDFVSRYVAVLESDPSLGGVSGKINQPSEPIPVEKEGVVGRVLKHGKVIANYASNTKTYIDSLHGVSLYRKAAFDKAGVFDENYGGNAMRQETDMSMRIKRAGFKLIFDPSIEFIHIKAPMGGTRRKTDRIQWYFDLFHNEMLFFLKNCEWKYMPLFFLSKTRPILACMFYYGKGRPRALVTPFRGFRAAFKTYRKEKAEGKI
jgi:GT2 family glycosyltransferase